MYVVQIKGSNGAGKTTIVKNLLKLDGFGGEPYLKNGDGLEVATINPNVGWAAIGKYDERKIVGCDRLKSIQAIKDALRLTVQYCLQHTDLYYGVVFEGMMISTIKSTFYDYLAWMADEYGIRPRFVILEATVEGCVSRIHARGTARAKLKVDKVAGKCALVIRHAATYNPALVRRIDVENTPEDQMLPEFLKAVGDTEMLALC